MDLILMAINAEDVDKVTKAIQAEAPDSQPYLALVVMGANLTKSDLMGAACVGMQAGGKSFKLI
ncbi:MAG: hypothetical protein KAS02_00920 [Candidatus Pacebacteria bacterium]|nr:hypothetical protein [Candidatus Paceibacterota bacterium]